MARDLLSVFIEFEAESQHAVHQYLEREYLHKGTWKLPWCAVYTERPNGLRFPAIIVKAQCGPLYERTEEES